MESDWVYCHFRQKKDSLNNFNKSNLKNNTVQMKFFSGFSLHDMIREIISYIKMPDLRIYSQVWHQGYDVTCFKLKT